jgi:hypothetical protein
MRAVEGLGGETSRPQVALHDVQKAHIAGSGGFDATRPFLAISGGASRAIRVLPDNVAAAVQLAPEVPPAEIQQA